MKYCNISRLKMGFLKGCLIVACLIPSMMTAQNRGNAPGFQGMDDVSIPSARVSAIGGAFTAMNGDVNALYFNPAGLSGISGLQVALNMHSQNRSWRENQEYRPNRRFVTLPFYLEKLYIPDPANNGRWDHEVFFEGLLDTAYIVSLPDTGQEPYSTEAADWKHDVSKSGISDITFAVPLTLGNTNLTFAAGIKPSTPIQDYDRNETWLDPHIAYIEYDMIPQLDGSDTVRMHWYDFERSRTGTAMNIFAAMSADILPWLSAGAGFEYYSSETEDRLSKHKIGYFDLFYENQFMYSYDTLDIQYDGTSTFSFLKTNVGLLIKRDHLSVGLNVSLPYSINRDFSYEKSVTDTLGTTTRSLSGTESVEIPAGFALGVVLKPAEKFLMTLDWTLTPYSNAEWSWDETLEGEQREWANQKSLRFGMEFTPLTYLTFRGGYRADSQVFIPDGAARIDWGPDRITWSLGAGLNAGRFGTLNASVLFSTLKYYDQYFSNINYVTDESTRWVIGYAYTF